MIFNPQPKHKRVLDQKYLDWVETQMCMGCGAQADDAHHLIGLGFGGMAMKADDYLSMPVCRGDHNKIHLNRKRWEKENHTQLACILFTLDRAYQKGKINLGIYEKYTQICTDAWE